MPPAARKSLVLIGLVCVPLSLCAWALYAAMYRLGPAQDFMVFHTAGRAWLDGDHRLIFDIAAFTARIQADYGTWFAKPIDPHPWVYPPLFLLLAVPLGLMPLVVALPLFLAGSFVALNGALRCYLPPGWQRWACAISLLLAPPTPFAIGAGQNSLLLAALLVGGFGLARRAPIGAGVLLGILCCKPQLWLMVPVALLAARRWVVLAAMAATIALLVLVSLAAFGSAPWRAWLSLVLQPNPDFQRWMEFGRMWGQSAYTNAMLLGTPTLVANAWQCAVTLGSAALVWWCYRRSTLPDDLRLAVLLTATILAAPHVSNYDAVMVTVAVSLFLCRALTAGLRPIEAVIAVAAWSVELLDPPRAISWGLVTPLVYVAFLVVVIVRGQDANSSGDGPREIDAPARQT